MSNKFDELITFSIAKKDNVDEIMEFFYQYWSKTHILSTDKNFFEYEFGNEGGQINFLLARNKNSGELLGIYGFYPYNLKMDSGLLDVAGGPSKVRPSCNIPFLGLEMYKRLPQLLGARTVIGVGLNENTSFQISSRLLKRYVGRMRHFYRLNNSGSYSVARINNEILLTINEPTQCELEEVTSINELLENLNVDSFTERVPFKDKGYIEKRYFNHPIYKYRIYVLKSHMALVTREIKVKGVTILRIVDVLGNLEFLKYVGKFLDRLLYENKYEYIDFVETGLSDDSLTRMGFVENIGDINIIPNYFEPFIQSNVDIFFDSTNPSAVIFKADADQDRPNGRGKRNA